MERSDFATLSVAILTKAQAQSQDISLDSYCSTCSAGPFSSNFSVCSTCRIVLCSTCFRNQAHPHPKWVRVVDAAAPAVPPVSPLQQVCPPAGPHQIPADPPRCMGCSRLKVAFVSSTTPAQYSCEQCYAGISHAPGAWLPLNDAGVATTADSNTGAQSCIICFEHPRTRVFIPCGHVICCDTCAVRIFGETQRCPACNGHINQSFAVFMP